MKGYTGTLASGEAIHYVDRKRWFWLMSVLYPLQPFIGIALHASTGNEWWLLLPLALNYGLGPLLDWLVDLQDPVVNHAGPSDHGRARRDAGRSVVNGDLTCSPRFVHP